MEMTNARTTTIECEDDECSLTTSQTDGTSQEWMEINRTIVDKGLSPAVGNWIALTTPNGAPANPFQIHQALL